MCGVAGFWDFDSRSAFDTDELIEGILPKLKRRGPDADGSWVDSDERVALIHTRLSIIDLTEQAHQPMLFNDTRFVISFNGEIFNFQELRKDLESVSVKFSTNSDTEVLLKACETWGIHKTLDKLEGMFAFALFDRISKRLFLARDQVGIKPMYYGFIGQCFVFGSNLATIESHPNFTRKIDSKSLASFMRYSYVPAPASIYEGIYKVKPGEVIEVGKNSEIKAITYWRPNKEVDSVPRISEADDNTLIRNLKRTLTDSVKRSMYSDVEIGAFLSGGIDSSLTAALMQEVSSNPISTFTIGFEDSKYAEQNYARQVAEILGTNHSEFIFSIKDLLTYIEEIPEAYDEPFADSSQLPTLLLCQSARNKVKVAISGDGGDELFGGYDRYRWAEKLERFNELPMRHFHTPINHFCKKFPQGKAISSIRKLGFGNRQIVKLDGIYHLSRLNLERNNLKYIYDTIPMSVAANRDLEFLVSENEQEWAGTKISIGESKSLSEQLQIVDFATYLPDDILQKVDRASMHFSLEVRVPMLNVSVIECAANFSQRQKIRKGVGKIPLRQILLDYLPEGLIDRPKHGFSVPLSSWLRNELFEWAENLISEQLPRCSHLINEESAKRLWSNFRTGQADYTLSTVWNLLVFLQWYRKH